MFFIQKGMFLYEWECSFLLINNKFVAKKCFFNTSTHDIYSNIAKC